MKIWYFLQMPPEKWYFQKKIVLEYDLSCIIWKDGIFFRKIRFSFLNWKWKIIFLKKYMEIWYFQMLQKKSEMIFFRKNTLKGDWHSRSHSRKSSNDSLYFSGDLHKRFHILLYSETGNLIDRIEIWLLLQFIRLEIFYNEESILFVFWRPEKP